MTKQKTSLPALLSVGLSSAAIVWASIFYQGTSSIIQPPDTPVDRGEIVGPEGPYKIGDLLSFDIPKDVVQPIWDLVPDKLKRKTADDDHNLQLSSDVPGDYTIVLAGIRDGRTVAWRKQFLIPAVSPAPTPTPTPTKPVPTPTPVPTPVPTPTEKVTAVTYVYEKGDTAIPSPVLAGLNRLNRERGILATVVEQDVTDGDGEIPDQYKAPIAAARAAGLPAVVATVGEKVHKVVKDPQTEQQIWEIAQ